MVIGFGTVGYTNTAATAAPIENNLQLAQVGVRSGITPPTPLNLRPRSHTPLPQSNYSHYPSRYDRRYGNYRRHDPHYGDRHYYRHSHRHTHHNRHRNRGKVIIISPGNHSGFSNYSNNGYIRVIGK